MKKFLVCATAAALLLTGCGQKPAQTGDAAKYKAGTVEAAATGFGGELKISVEFSDNKIEAINVGENEETPTVGGAALEQLVAQALEKQSAEIDGVAGATITSDAFKDALNKAIAQASGAEADKNVEIKDGTYEGEASGKQGPIKVAVTIKDSKIADVEVTEAHETLGFEKAFDIVKQDIINTNSTAVDAVTSATMASNGMIRAVVDALDKAGMAEAFATKQGDVVRPEVQDEYNVDVAIVGAGGAGTTAAIEAMKAGKNVLVLEKALVPGGNTKLSDGALNASETSVQKELGVKDTTEGFYKDTFVGGGEFGNTDLVNILVNNSADAIDFLKGMGVEWKDVITGDGATGQRCHLADGKGAKVFDLMYKAAEEQGINVLYGTEAKQLIVDNGAVVGVMAENNGKQVRVNAKSVILATGGYGHNGDILGKYDEKYIPGTLCTNTVLATGSGITMATEAGANLVGMEFVQKHPTCNAATGDLLSSANNGRGLGTTMMVNINGQRFCEELETRLTLANAILAQPDQKSYSFFDQKAADETEFFEKYGDEINKLIASGEAVKADTIDEACAFFGINAENFKAELEKYNGFAKNGKDEDFNRRDGLREYSLTDGPFYFIRSTPAIHHTMGGVEINTNTEVLDTKGNVIPGLYAAGEVTGGIHGNNRLGGNALDDIIVFGRIAGQNAAANVAE